MKLFGTDLHHKYFGFRLRHSQWAISLENYMAQLPAGLAQDNQCNCRNLKLEVTLWVCPLVRGMLTYLRTPWTDSPEYVIMSQICVYNIHFLVSVITKAKSMFCAKFYFYAATLCKYQMWSKLNPFCVRVSWFTVKPV